MSRVLTDRLTALMEERGLTGRALSKLAGLNETAVRDVLQNGNPTLRTIEAIAHALGVDPITLISPVGTMTAEEAELIEHYRSLTATRRDAILQVARTMDDARDQTPPDAADPSNS